MIDPIPHELHDLLDGRLDDEAAAAVRARIASDATWAEAWAELERIQAWVRDHGADREPPSALREGIRARIAVLEGEGPQDATAAPGPDAEAGTGSAEPSAPSARRRPTRLLRILTVGYAAAALLVVGFTIGYVTLINPPASGTLDDMTVETADGIQPHGGVEDREALEPPAFEKGASTAEDKLGAPSGMKDEGAREQAKRLDESIARERGLPERKEGEQAPGRFDGPGGGVRPALREPSDKPAPTTAPAPPAPGEKKARGVRAGSRLAESEGRPGDARSGSASGQGFGQPKSKAKADDTWAGSRDTLARLASRMDAGEIVYVIETDDPAGMRKRLETTLDTLLATAARPVARRSSGEQPAADAPAADAPAAENAKDESDADAGEPLGLGGGARGRMPPSGAPRFYRLEPAAVAGLRARLAGGATTPLAERGEIERPVAPALLARLEADLASLVRESSPAESSRAEGAATRRARSAKRAPGSEPRPSPAPSKRAKKPATDEKQPDGATRDPASGAKPARESNAPRRVRILILERK